MTAPAIESFIAVVEGILDDRDDGGKVMPVVLVNPDPDEVNVSYRRNGGGEIRQGMSVSRGRVREVLLEWTVTNPVWQTANDVNEKIIAALLEAKGFYSLSPPEDDVFVDEGKGPVFSITTSANLRDTNWGPR